MSEPFTIGQKVWWLYKPPGGYGYTFAIYAVIERINPTRIQIQAYRRIGDPVLRWVKPDRLRPRTSQTYKWNPLID